LLKNDVFKGVACQLTCVLIYNDKT